MTKVVDGSTEHLGAVHSTPKEVRAIKQLGKQERKWQKIHFEQK